MDKKSQIKVPFRFFIMLIFLLIFIILLSINGWTMSLYFLTIIILFNIFFNFEYIQENFQLENIIIDGKEIKKTNCNVYKENALDNIDKYYNCKKKIKPKIVCPIDFKSSKDIKNNANKRKDLIPDIQFLKQKEPNNKNRVCGLIPGSQFIKKQLQKNTSTLMSDEELKTAINNDILLNNELMRLENKLIEDPSDKESKKLFNKIKESINILKPDIIYNLREKNKDSNFIKQAINV